MNKGILCRVAGIRTLVLSSTSFSLIFYQEVPSEGCVTLHCSPTVGFKWPSVVNKVGGFWLASFQASQKYGRTCEAWSLPFTGAPYLQTLGWAERLARLNQMPWLIWLWCDQWRTKKFKN